MSLRHRSFWRLSARYLKLSSKNRSKELIVSNLRIDNKHRVWSRLSRRTLYTETVIPTVCYNRLSTASHRARCSQKLYCQQTGRPLGQQGETQQQRVAAIRRRYNKTFLSADKTLLWRLIYTQFIHDQYLSDSDKFLECRTYLYAGETIRRKPILL